MRTLGAILVLSLGLVGCGSVGGPIGTPATAKSAPKQIAVPDEAPATRIGLIRNSNLVRVGQTPDTALGVFPKPEKGHALNELPGEWPEGFKAVGWESDTEGFGAILWGGRIAATVYTEEDVSEDRVQEVLSDYIRFLGDPSAQPASAAGRYWIWEDAPCRGVICASWNAKGATVLTVGAGYASVLDVLGMSATGAAKDLAEAAKMRASTSKE